jgi:hypothetical protein
VTVPFFVITGSFHLVGRTSTGAESGFEPDGDSMQFRPANPALLDLLTQVGARYKLTAIGSTQLRFEGIDALELHFDGTHQPRPIADRSRNYLTGELDMNPVPYRPPKNTRVRPPVMRDAIPGFILSRSLEAKGRPVAFAYEGAPPQADGSEVYLRPSLLRQSLNFRSLERGHAYPLFYDTLFADLRKALAQAAISARRARRGLWRSDRSSRGLAVTDQAALEREGVIFPKLFRRLTDFLKQPGATMDRFLLWLAATKEQVLELPSMNFTHFDDVLAVQGNTVKMRLRPEEIAFVSAKSRSTEVAPWLRV